MRQPRAPRLWREVSLSPFEGGQRQEGCAPRGQQQSEVWSQRSDQPKTRPDWRAKGVQDPRFAWASSKTCRSDRH